MNRSDDFANGVRPLLRRLSIVVPVYRSEEILPELVRRLEPVLRSHGENFELIFVNDCSPDRSWNVICDLARENPWVRGINLMRNYGQHNALLCGIRTARYDVIVTMDDDLQHPPEEIPKLLARLAQGSDVVYGTPEREQHGLGRDFASWITKLALQNVMGAEIARKVSAFRAFRSEVARAFAHYSGAFVSIDVLLTWGTNRFSLVPVHHEQRKAGVSGYTITKTCHACDEYDDRLQHRTITVCKRSGFRFYIVWRWGSCLRGWTVCFNRRQCPGVPISCVDHRHIFRSAAICARELLENIWPECIFG